MSKKDDALLTGLDRIRAEMDLKKKSAASKAPGAIDPPSKPEPNNDNGENIVTNKISNRKSIRISNSNKIEPPPESNMLDFLLPHLDYKEAKNNFSYYIKVKNKERLALLSRSYGYDKASPLLDGILSKLFDSMGAEYWEQIEAAFGQKRRGKEVP